MTVGEYRSQSRNPLSPVRVHSVRTVHPPVAWLRISTQYALLENIKMTFERKASCRRHRMKSKITGCERVWSRAREKDVPPDVQHEFNSSALVTFYEDDMSHLIRRYLTRKNVVIQWSTHSFSTVIYSTSFTYPPPPPPPTTYHILQNSNSVIIKISWSLEFLNVSSSANFKAF
jgi:hypothetical protein